MAIPIKCLIFENQLRARALQDLAKAKGQMVGKLMGWRIQRRADPINFIEERNTFLNKVYPGSVVQALFEGVRIGELVGFYDAWGQS